MFEKLEDDGLAPRSVNLMSIHQSQTAQQVDEVQTPIKCVEGGPVDILEVSPVSGEVIVGVGEGVDDELHSDHYYHHNTQHG